MVDSCYLKHLESLLIDLGTEDKRFNLEPFLFHWMKP